MERARKEPLPPRALAHPSPAPRAWQRHHGRFGMAPVAEDPPSIFPQLWRGRALPGPPLPSDDVEKGKPLRRKVETRWAPLADADEAAQQGSGQSVAGASLHLGPHPMKDFLETAAILASQDPKSVEAVRIARSAASPAGGGGRSPDRRSPNLQWQRQRRGNPSASARFATISPVSRMSPGLLLRRHDDEGPIVVGHGLSHGGVIEAPDVVYARRPGGWGAHHRRSIALWVSTEQLTSSPRPSRTASRAERASCAPPPRG